MGQKMAAVGGAGPKATLLARAVRPGASAAPPAGDYKAHPRDHATQSPGQPRAAAGAPARFAKLA